MPHLCRIYAASPDACRSLYVQGELTVAERFNKRVIPVWLAGEHWPDSAPLHMARTQYVDGRGAQIADAAARLAAALGLPLPTPVTAPPEPEAPLSAPTSSSPDPESERAVRGATDPSAPPVASVETTAPAASPELGATPAKRPARPASISRRGLLVASAGVIATAATIGGLDAVLSGGGSRGNVTRPTPTATRSAPTATPRPSGELVWKYPTGGRILASPAVVGGLVFITSMDGNLYALDALTGTLAWPYHTGVKPPPWNVASPTVANDVVYFGLQSGDFFAIDIATRKSLWRIRVNGGISTGTPAVANGLVYFGSDDGFLHAVDVYAGTTRWQYNFHSTFWSALNYTPVIANGTLYVTCSDDYLYAFDATRGNLKWRFPTNGVAIAAQTLANGLVYVPSTDYSLQSPDGYLYAVNVTTDKQQWLFHSSSVIGITPLVANGLVYAAPGSGEVHVLNAINGASERALNSGSVTSGLALANGALYFGGGDHAIHALDAITGAARWRFPTPNTNYSNSEYSTPVIANGLVYIISDNHILYALTA